MSDRLNTAKGLIDNSFCSVDGTDCPINERNLFNSGWYCHKSMVQEYFTRLYSVTMMEILYGLMDLFYVVHILISKTLNPI